MNRSAFLTRLLEATNAHDVDRIVDCFTADYDNRTPCHPARAFTGTEQVRRNWEVILAGVPDLVADVVAESSTGDQVWSEWEMRGTRRDRSPHVMRGVIVFAVEGDRARSCRFYLEPVDDAQLTADGFVATLTADGSP
jgi:hypothetical protein